jgi:hypothetical protein
MILVTSGTSSPMSPPDDDDWVGTPPEGRISRDRANPGYWNRSWPVAAAAGAALFLLVVVVVVLALVA